MFKFTSQKTKENAPILYFIHGGGFFAGNTKVVSEALRYLVDTFGVIAFGIDYRLAPEHPYPTGHHDAYAGLNWIYNHAESFGGDKHNIFVTGDSAGGNLTLYCANQNIKESKDMIKGQILLYPTVNIARIDDEYTRYDLNKVDIYKKHKNIIKLQLGLAPQLAEGMALVLKVDDLLNVDITPYTEVSKNMPPTLMATGEHDSFIFENLAYAKKLNDQDVDTTFLMYKGLGHAFIDKTGVLPQAEDALNEIGKFIEEKSGIEDK